MLLLSGNNLKKTFLDRKLFDDVSFNVYSSDKIGFVGVNGVGKSTLFKMITDQIDYDGGEIFKSKETKISYLEQYKIPDGNISVMEEMLTGFSEVIQIENELDEIIGEIANNRGDMEKLIARQEILQERFIELDGMCYRSKIKSALMGLGFSEEDLNAPLNKLSGGQRTRIALCKILLSDANLLLLDEPTNHLDIESIEWLEEFLMNYKGAYIIISHDRYFLDKVTTKTFELENNHFRSFDGNYSAYIAQREIEKLTTQRNYDWTTREIHRLEEVIEQQRRWKHKKNKKTHTLDNTRKAIERLEKTIVEPDKDPDKMNFRFKACDGGAKNVLVAKNLEIEFDQKRIFRNVNMHILKGEKVFLLGPNGCGKTTLLKIILNIYHQTSGEYKIGDNIKIGYYDQLKENLHRDKTVIDEIWNENHLLSQTEIRNALALFLFKGEDVFKDIRSLSGGELARVELAKILLANVNFIIMDEPTNHLDVLSREALENALANYDGTMLMVSHDRYFINKLADRILYLTSDGIIEYDGNYDDFISSRQKVTLSKNDIKPIEKINNYKERKQIESEKRKKLNRIKKIEESIKEKESKLDKLNIEYENPEISSDYIKLTEISNELSIVKKEIDDLMDEWFSLQDPQE